MVAGSSTVQHCSCVTRKTSKRASERANARAIGVNIVANGKVGISYDLGLHSSETVPLSPPVLVVWQCQSRVTKILRTVEGRRWFSRREGETPLICIMQCAIRVVSLLSENYTVLLIAHWLNRAFSNVKSGAILARISSVERNKIITLNDRYSLESSLFGLCQFRLETTL